jgi:UPF0271 protein
MKPTVDLNCDLGEGAGNDEALMELATSVNIACGGHAGDESTMRATLLLARQHGVAAGAHPGFADRDHFGRRELAVPPEDIVRLVGAHVSDLQRIARSEGVLLTHVKPHGALYNMAARDARVADAVAEAVAGVDARLWLFGLAGGELLKAGHARGLRVAAEVFADRTYQSDGSLTPRSSPAALHTETVEMVRQVLRMIREGAVRSVDGRDVPITADTVCLHGDGAHAVEFARTLRAALAAEGVVVRPLVSPFLK